MLSGDRVVLRGIERGDLPSLWEMFNDLEVVHRANDTRPLPTSLARLEARFDARTAEPETDVVRFAITVDDVVIGQCTLHDFDDYARTCNLGIMLRRERWGQGHGSDAVRTLVRYAFGPLNFRKVSLEALADDPRAVGAYRKVGFVEEGRFREQAWFEGNYRDIVRMAMLRDH